MSALPKIADTLGDWRWRLSNLYWIIDEQGKRVKFVPNDMQDEFLHELHDNNLILKARQHGFTTLIDILALDQAFFTPNYAAAIIAHGLDPASKIFRNKIKYPLDNLPDSIRAMNPTVNDSASELVFKNNSSVYVGTSARSGTLQFLHISEYGKICRRYPDKALEIKTGSLPAVHDGGLTFVESTAEGTGGHFFEMVDEALKRPKNKKPHKKEFKLHFFPWWRKQSYRTDPEGVYISNTLIDYFNELEEKHGIYLDDAQVAWYALKEKLFKGDMKQEYPSTPEEAFSGAMEERYFSEQMAKVRKENRIRLVPLMAGRGVNLFFDIGRDTTACWFHQHGALEHRFVDYYQNVGKTLDYTASEIQKRGYRINNIYLPHDAGDESVVTTDTAEKKMKRLFPNATVRVVKRTPQKSMSIDAARSILQECYFDDEKCSPEGIWCLDNYRKKWNESLGNWSEDPVHDPASHGADAFQTFAQGWEKAHEESGPIGPPVKAWRPKDRTVGY